MNNEDYVTFDTARMLHAAGYPQDDNSDKAYDANGWLKAHSDEIDGETYAAPHLWTAMKWLRNQHGIHVFPDLHYKGFYLVSICSLEDNYFYDDSYPYETYESACDAGIAHACTWVIKQNQ